MSYENFEYRARKYVRRLNWKYSNESRNEYTKVLLNASGKVTLTGIRFDLRDYSISRTKEMQTRGSESIFLPDESSPAPEDAAVTTHSRSTRGVNWFREFQGTRTSADLPFVFKASVYERYTATPSSTRASLRPKYNVSVIKLRRGIPMARAAWEGLRAAATSERAFIPPLEDRGRGIYRRRGIARDINEITSELFRDDGRDVHKTAAYRERSGALCANKYTVASVKSRGDALAIHRESNEAETPSDE